MGIRSIRRDGDEVLRKKSKEVDQINDRVKLLLRDMTDTMYRADGIGLAAPQVGVLKRIIVVDDGNGLLQLINPCIVEKSGEQTYTEGCLSVPGIFGEVDRPACVRVEAIAPDGGKVSVDGRELLAVILCHEIDHLDGILFKDKAKRFVDKEDDRKKK
ncbi:MAG: peptide deformylase [Clostridiales bacterium]|nr:peptide deformylase [Clostridiales bacterium]